MEITKEFQNTQVKFKLDENGQSMVGIDEVAKFCGWTRVEEKNGKEYSSVMWHRVNKYLAELGFAHKCTKGDYIPEFVMYALIGKAKNGKATQFMLWVGQTLVELRTKGVVILESATSEAIDFEKKYGKYRIRKTFTNSLDIEKDYKEFIELAKVENKQGRLNNLERVKLCNIIVSSLENKINTDLLEMKPSQIIGFQEVISVIKTDIVKLSNRGNGGVKANQTKKIMKLEEILEDLKIPTLQEMYCVQVHPFSWNYAIKDGKRTWVYNKWIDEFPLDEIPSQQQWELDYGVDFNKPIKIYLRYVCQNRFDMDNLSKSFIDAMFNTYRGIYVDDAIIKAKDEQIIEYCNGFEDGKVYFYLENMSEEEMMNL